MTKFLGKKVLLALGIVALSLGTTTSTARAGFTVDDLINGTYSGPTITGHDVYYNGIDYVFNAGSYSATGTGAPAASAINVMAVTVGGIDTLRFTSGFASSGPFNDTSLSYEVKVLSGPAITDLHLRVTGGVSGGGFYAVDDSVVNLNPPFQSYGFGVDSTGAPSQTILTAPLTDFSVSKDIFLQGNFFGPPGTARLSIIDQGYSRAIPEPGSIALLLIGGAGAFGIVRRRKATTA